MSRHVRWFLFGYTAALILAESVPRYSHAAESWFWYWQVPAAYLVLTIGTFIHKAAEFELSRRWILALLMLSLTGAIATCLPGSNNSPSIEETATIFAFLLPYCVLSLAVFSLTPGYFRVQRRWVSFVSIGAAFTGVVLILASLVRETTISAVGWRILVQKDRWITSEYNVTAGFLDGRLAWFFALAGSVLYLLILTDAVLIAIWILKLHGSNQRLGSSRFFIGLAASSTFLTYWLYSDIFWGWQTVAWYVLADVDRNLLLAVVGLVLWLAGPTFACWLIVHAPRNGSGRRTLLTIQALQLPIAGFNFTLVPSFFGQDFFTDFPGLGLLIIGSQVLTWACIVLLIAGGGEKTGKAAEELSGLVQTSS
jgi:hypothetical protein